MTAQRIFVLTLTNDGISSCRPPRLSEALSSPQSFLYHMNLCLLADAVPVSAAALPRWLVNRYELLWRMKRKVRKEPRSPPVVVKVDVESYVLL
jgi:hypothetical protein